MCLEIEKRYEIRFVEIGMEEDHVHLLVQGVPTMPVTRIVTIIKSITAREIFKAHTRIKKDVLWGGNLWTSGYYANKDTIKMYIQNQGKKEDSYKKLYESQPELDFGM